MKNLRTVGLAGVILLSLFGIFVGGLLTWHHDTQLYAGAAAGTLWGCAESTEVNCDIVNTSAWSELLGIPIATLAMAFYAGTAVLGALAIKRDEARAVLIAAGVGAVAYSALLYGVSKVELHYVCAWCIRLYATNAGLLLMALLGGKAPLPSGGTIGTALAVWLGLAVVGAGGERMWRGTLAGEGPKEQVAAEGAERTKDPEGPAPTIELQVTTEDGHPATLKVEPDDAWTGNRDAKVSVVMFGDLECGFCKRSSAELARLEATYGDRVLFVFKHYPMDPACNPGVKNRKHRYACRASQAAVCAQQQGVFWAFHDLAYKNQHQLGDEYLTRYAAEAGADPEAFTACMATPESLKPVVEDAKVGAALEQHGTPRIWVNGQLHRSGSSAEVMARVIELALGATAEEAAKQAATLRDRPDAAPPLPADTPATRSLSYGHAFEMDTFEAAVKDGSAVSALHEVPAFHVSWFEAKEACEAAGKRMCTEREWVSACQGAEAQDDNGNGEFADDLIEGTAYPYGDYHDRGRCWDDHEGEGFRPVYTGEMPGCASKDGVMDLTGNVEEWVGEDPEHAVLLGGAWDTDTDHARCYRRNASFGAGWSGPRTGFRCCR